MEKRFEGGTNLLYIPLSPNAVKGFGVDDTIQNRGENAIRVQFQPCACKTKLPDCMVKGCYDGFIRTFQDYREIIAEVIPDDGLGGKKIYPRFFPLKDVLKVDLIRDETREPLQITRIEEDHFEVNKDLAYYHVVEVTYRAKTTVERMGQIEVIQPTKKVDLGYYLQDIPEVVLSVKETYLNGKKIESVGNTFNAILFQENVAGKLNYVVKNYTPFKLAYRESSVMDEKTDRASLKLQSGDIQVTISQSERVAEGDIITLVGMYFNISEYVEFKPDKPYDYLMYAPIREIINCFAIIDNETVELFEGKDFVIMDLERILWLKEKPRGGYSIRYSYHPSYRLQKATGGANESKNTPRDYVGKFIANYRSL